MRAHPAGHSCRVVAHGAAADHDDIRRPSPGHPSHQNAATTRGLHQVVGPNLGGQAPGDLAHRGQQRQLTIDGLHGLVGDRRRARAQQRLGALRRRGQMQVGEERLAAVQEWIFGFDRFLDLE